MKINKLLYSVFILAITFVSCDKGEGFVYNDDHIFNKESDIARMSIIAGAASSTAYGSFIDLIKGDIYTNSTAIGQSQQIDLIFQHSASNNANLLTTDCATLNSFAGAYNVVQQFAQINSSHIFKVKAASAGFINYDSIISSNQIFSAFENAETALLDLDTYDSVNDGPGDRLRNLAVGDIVFFKSFTRNCYAILRVSAITTGATGNIRLDVKSTNKPKL